MNSKPNVVPASLLRTTLNAVREAEELHARLQGDQFAVTFGDGDRILGRVFWDSQTQEMSVDYSIYYGTY
jgi:hypothetical protein